MLTAELTIQTERGDKTFELRENNPLFAGRTVECDLCLPSPVVSRRHAVFLARGGECGVKDLKSVNGTYLNGKRISKPMRLKDGDIVQIAGFIIKVKIPGKVAYKEAKKTLLIPEDRSEEIKRVMAQRASSFIDNLGLDEAFADQEESEAPAEKGAPRLLEPAKPPGLAPAPPSGRAGSGKAVGVPPEAPSPPPKLLHAPPPASRLRPPEEEPAALRPSLEKSTAEPPSTPSPSPVEPVEEKPVPPPPKADTPPAPKQGDPARAVSPAPRPEEAAPDRVEAPAAPAENIPTDKRKTVIHVVPREIELAALADAPVELPGSGVPVIRLDDGMLLAEDEATTEDVLRDVPPARSEPPAESPAVPSHSAPEASARSGHSTSIRLRMHIADEEVGDGDGDDDEQFMGQTPGDAEEPDSELALAKAAAEAGLVGEFVPDIPEHGSGAHAEQVDDGVVLALAGSRSESMAVDPFAIPIDAAFREAIEARLFLYAFLADLKAERECVREEHPNLADAVKSELARQDREADKLLSAEKAEEMIEKRLARREELKQKIRAAKESGGALPPRPSRRMREAEELAINQWTMMAQSERDALPAVYAEGYRITRVEPLAAALEEAGIDCRTLLGGGAYLLALGVILEETKHERALAKSRLSDLAAPDERKAGGRKLLGLFGAAQEKEEEPDAAAPGENAGELAEEEHKLAARIGWIGQELAYVETLLIKEFWNVYARTAEVFLPRHEKMTLAVRAFLRYGVVGFMPWWIRDEVCDHIMNDLSREVNLKMRISRDVTNVMYADEYLAAVMNMECTPAMDENLEINERNSPNWKADKALRKLINSRAQTARLRELVESLETRMEEQESQSAAIEERIANLLPGSKNLKQTKNELAQKRQAHRVEAAKLKNLVVKIREQTLAMLEETIEETENRFDSGELPRPSRDFLIRRECEALRRLGRLLSNLKERFLPLVLKENFILGLDAVNDRPAILGEIEEMERRDPAIFLENLVPSKKKANRVELRVSPVVVLVPAAGVLAFSWNPRQKPEDGRLAVPTCFIRPRLRERQLTYLLSDFRWDTAKAAAGMDVMNSDTIVAAFMSVRWDWRKRSKEAREKGLIYTEQNDRTNWRRVYEAYMLTAYEGGKKLYNRNYDFYERIVGKYFDLPDGVTLLKK